MRRNNKKKNRRKNIISNVLISLLFIIIIGFIISGVNNFFNNGLNISSPDLSTLLTKSKYEKKTGHKIEIEIWNGCGIPNLATLYSDFLRSEGIDVLDSKNADNFEYIESKILHHRGEIERALALAEILKINNNNIVENKNETLFFDLTLIIGEDYNELGSYKSAIMYQKPY